MVPTRFVQRASGLAAALVLLAAIPLGAAAQAGDGFLFRAPMVTLGFKAGYAVPRAGSEVFDFTQDLLTVSDGDFNSSAWGGDLGVRVAERWELVMSALYSKAETRSEFREWVDGDDNPIEQTTSFKRLPLTFGLKRYVKDRGRSVGRFAWVPEQWNAYVGAAGGWTFYEFDQVGDFVDFQTLDIFSDRFRSEGNAPTVQLLGGFEYTLSPRLLLTTEARYGWARAEMGSDFVDFDRMDLAGFQATVGLSARF